MNTFQSIDTCYIRASRTIETVLVSNEKSSKVFFIYNYEGTFFRVFRNHLELLEFFKNDKESDFCFESEDNLDLFLANVQI